MRIIAARSPCWPARLDIRYRKAQCSECGNGAQDKYEVLCFVADFCGATVARPAGAGVEPAVVVRTELRELSRGSHCFEQDDSGGGLPGHDQWFNASAGREPQ